MKKNKINQFIDGCQFSNFHVMLVILGLFLIAFTGYGATAYGSIIPSIIEAWNVDSKTLGYIGSMSEFGSMFGAILLTILSNKIGSKKVLISSVMTFCAFTFLQSVVNGAIIFAVFRFLAGFGFGGVIPLVISLLSEYAPGKNKSKSVAIALSGNQVGSIIASLVAIAVMPHFGWRPVLWMALIPVVFLAFIIKFVPESTQYLVRTKQPEQIKKILSKIDKNYASKIDVDQIVEETAAEKSEQKKISYFNLFDRNYGVMTVLSCVIYIMGLLFINGVIVWLPSVMVQNGFSLGPSLAFSVFLNIGTIVGTATWGVVADKKGFKILLPAIYTIGAIALMLMGVKINIVVLFLFVFLIGFFLFSAHSLVNAYVSQHYPEELSTSAVGLANSVGRIGGITGPTLGGLLLSANASIAVWFIVFGSTGLIAALCFIIINAFEKSKNK